MASDEAIAALRAQIDAVLETSGADTGTWRPAKQGARKNRHRSASAQTANPEDANSKASADSAFKRIVSLVNASEKSERIVRERLSRLEFQQSAIDSAVHKAKEYGLIDDTRYGEILVRSRVSQGKGSVGIERELADNGIDPLSIPGYPEEYALTPDSEFDRALSLLERKPPRAKNAREAAYRKLVQKGYPSSIASSAARAWYDAQRSRFIEA